jgi:hypothetical protein
VIAVFQNGNGSITPLLKRDESLAFVLVYPHKGPAAGVEKPYSQTKERIDSETAVKRP